MTTTTPTTMTVELNGKTYTAVEIRKLIDENRQLSELNEDYCSEALFGRSLIAENDALKAQLDAISNNTAAQLAESRRHLDLFGQEVLALARQIDCIPNAVFTHNDHLYLNQIESYLAALAIAFQRRRGSFISYSIEALESA